MHGPITIFDAKPNRKLWTASANYMTNNLAGTRYSFNAVGTEGGFCAGTNCPSSSIVMVLVGGFAAAFTVMKYV